MSLDLGRVQGASIFHTSAASSASISVSSLQPQLTPFVGDAVQFPNGDVRQINAVSGSTVTLGEVLFSYKGDPGIGNATLSNIDGDSTENGFPQAAVKGVAQSKNFYNEGFYDSSVFNGDDKATVTRKTLINEDGTQSLLPTQYQYTEQIPKNQPIRLLPFEGELKLYKEWRKGLNLVSEVLANRAVDVNTGNYFTANNWFASRKIKVEVGKTYYANTLSSLSFYDANGNYLRQPFYSGQNVSVYHFTCPNDVGFVVITKIGDASLMLTKGSHPYPYEPYYGGIVRQKDLSGIQLFPANVNPAQTIGGDWEDLGTVPVGGTTLHAYRRL